MKKAFRFFLAAMMASALFLGCSTDDGDSGDEENNNNLESSEETAQVNTFLEKLPGVYARTTRTDGVVCAVKITESNGTYTLERWGCSGKNESGQFITETENFTAKDLVKIPSYESGYKKYGYRYYFKGKSSSKWKMGLTDNDSIFYDCLTNSYTRRDSSFDFYAGTDKESSSASAGSGSSSSSLPSDFDITAGTWTYTGTSGSVSITYTVTFKSDGTVTVTKSGRSQASGTWSLSGSTLTLDVKNSSTEAKDKFTLSSSGSSLTLTLSGDSSYTTSGSPYTTSDYSMALTVMFMSSSKTATLTASN